MAKTEGEVVAERRRVEVPKRHATAPREVVPAAALTRSAVSSYRALLGFLCGSAHSRAFQYNKTRQLLPFSTNRSKAGLFANKSVPDDNGVFAE